MNEKTLEKVTKLSRRQIIMLQKKVIERKNKVIVGITYDYSDEEVELFQMAKFLKDCGYTYPEIKKEMDKYKYNKEEVLDDAIAKMENKIEDLKCNIIKALKLKRGEKVF